MEPSVGFAPPTSTTIPRLPFTLKLLKFGLVSSHKTPMPPPQLVIALLEASKSSAVIRVLEEPFHSPTQILAPPLLSAPCNPLPLRMLRLEFSTSFVHLVHPLLPVLRQCTSILSLIYSEPHHEVFAALGSQLEILVPSIASITHDYAQEINLLRAGHYSLSQLKKLFHFATPSHINLLALKRECEARGIETSWEGWEEMPAGSSAHSMFADSNLQRADSLSIARRAGSPRFEVSRTRSMLGAGHQESWS